MVLLIIIPVVIGYFLLYGMVRIFTTVERLIKCIRFKDIFMTVIVIGCLAVLYNLASKKVTNYDYFSTKYRPELAVVEIDTMRAVFPISYAPSKNYTDSTRIERLLDSTSVDTIMNKLYEITPIWEKVTMKGFLTWTSNEVEVFNNEKEWKLCYILKLSEPIRIFTGSEYENQDEIHIVEDRILHISNFIGTNIEIDCILKPSMSSECAKIQTTNGLHNEHNLYRKLEP